MRLNEMKLISLTLKILTARCCVNTYNFFLSSKQQVFTRIGEMSAVFKQPTSGEERLKALQVLLQFDSFVSVLDNSCRSFFSQTTISTGL
jgi:hypothetical protein